MTCTCPKCEAAIEIESADISAEGSFHKCTGCGTSLVIRKESFAKRALYNSSDIACAECGTPPGTSIYCQSCHAIYPEILVIEKSSAGKKQLGKILASLAKFKNLKIQTKARVHREQVSIVTPSGKTKGAKPSGQPAQLVAIVAVILVVALAGGYFWRQDKIETEYTERYVSAVIGLKTARDFELGISTRVAASWKGGSSSSLTAAEMKSAASAKSDSDTLMKRIGKVPDKFAASHEAINKLYSNYGRLHGVVTATAGTADSYSAAVKKIDDEFMKSAKELKGILPEKIAETFNKSKGKYKNLQDI